MLSEKQLSSFKNRLEERKNSLNEQLEENNHLDIERSHVNESIGELSHYDNHPADTATALFEREKDIALLEHYEKELKDIDHALDQIAKNKYGMCETCGKDIPVERLEILPTATHCVQHSPDQVVSHNRPVEEGVLMPAFGKFEYDEKDATFFDAEDSWQEVQRYGTSETPSDFFDPEMLDYNSMLNEEDETISYVEELESFIGTDIYGKNIQIYPNAIHEKYEERLDEDGVMSVVGNLGAPKLDVEK
jgi:YteA family regulatory protein